MTIRVVVVDGHTLTRYGLSTLAGLNPDIEIVGEATTAAQVPSIVTKADPHVVTIDVALPDGDGLQLARELRDRHATLGIVMLTSYGADDVLFRALETGVSAFVSKDAPVEEVLGAIRHAAVAASSFTASGLASALTRRRTATDKPMLSPREREVLVLLRDGTSIPSIARSLFVSQSTAKTYVSRLYDKLGASNRTQALMVALRQGIIRNEESFVANCG
jgi:DNA-binding NarL/FixJ family response regulator